MSNRDIEVKLLEDYLSAAIKAETPADANGQLALYEKQLAVCKRQGFDFNVEWCEAMVFYVRAIHKLNAEGFAEKVLRDTARQSAGFEGILPALAAKGRETGRVREAIALLDQAINIYDDDADFWFMRAHLYYELKQKKDAQDNVDHILSRFGDDQKVYYEARKLKDKVESIQENNDRCFIATAVYEAPDSFELHVLRDYRDRVLLRSPIGKVAVACYYSVSPGIAHMLSKSRIARLVVRIVLLDPLVTSLNRRKNHG